MKPDLCRTADCVTRKKHPADRPHELGRRVSGKIKITARTKQKP
jgi:hypothetical protein